MIVAAARELAEQHVCFVGVGLPNIAVNLAKRTVAPDLELVYEAGVFGARPARLPLSIGDPTIVTGATAVVSMLELFGYYLQRGLIDVGFLGAAQIDRFGNINTTVIGDYEHPKTRLPGFGRRVRDRHQRARGVRDHAPEHAQLRRAGSTSGPAPATSAARSRPSASGARAAGWAAARRSSSRTWASTTSTRPARCASIRSTRARRSTPCARRSAGTSRSPRTWPSTAAAHRRGAAPHPRGARPGRRLHEVAPRTRARLGHPT